MNRFLNYSKITGLAPPPTPAPYLLFGSTPRPTSFARSGPDLAQAAGHSPFPARHLGDHSPPLLAPRMPTPLFSNSCVPAFLLIGLFFLLTMIVWGTSAFSGNELYPFCEKFPKSMLPIKNKPMIAYQLEMLQRWKVSRNCFSPSVAFTQPNLLAPSQPLCFS